MNTNTIPNHRALAGHQTPVSRRSATRSPISAWIGRSAFAAMLALGICFAPAQTVKDSAGFNLKLEMAVVPIPIYNSSKGWTSDGDWLTFNNPVNTDGAFGWSGQLVNSVGYTIEMRYRITQVNTPGTTSVLKYTFQFQGADGSGTLALHTLQVGMPVAGSQLGLYSAGGNLALPLTAGDWHTLRIADAPNSNDVLVWSDCVQIVGFNWQSGNNTVNRAWVGDLGGNVTDGIYNVDYYRVDTTGAYAPPAPAAPVVTQSPQSVTNDLGARITLAGKFSGLVSSLQWYKDNVPLANGDKLTYVIDPGTPADNGSYFLRATNAIGAADTAPAYVAVLDVDPTPPAVQGFAGLLTLQNVRVTYTKPMSPDTATNIANYYFQGNALVVRSANRIDQNTVELQTDFQTPGSNYTLFITNVLDTLSNSIAPNTSVRFTAPMVNPCVRYDAGTTTSQPSGPPDPTLAAGGYWMQTTNTNNGMLTNAVIDDLSTGLNAWQITDQNVLSTGGSLDYRMVIDQSSDNLAHANGWRLMTRCRLADNFSGTAADQIVLYSDTGLGARYGIFFGMNSSGNLTASLLGGSTYTLTSDGTSYHTHVLIYDPALAAASYYFDGQLIVANYVGQAASGYNGVAFGSASSTATGQMNYNLVQFDVLDGSRPVVTISPPSTTNGVGQKVTFTAGFIPFVGAYQWLSNNVIIPGATNASYTTSFISMDYNGSQYSCRALNALGNVETLPATLTVTSDTTPPSIVAVKYSLLLDRVTITYSEPVVEFYATNLANYVWVNPGMTNLSVTLLDPLTVELRTTPQQMGSNYTVRVSNIRDTSNLSIAANTPASFTPPGLEVLARYYAGTTTDTPAGAPDPVSAAGGGWSLLLTSDPNLSTNAVADDLGTGWNAWAVRDASTIANHLIEYSYLLAANVQQFARQHGWVMTVRSRFTEDLGTPYTMFAQYADDQLNRNVAYFDLSDSGDLTANLYNGSSFNTYNLTSGGAGATDYHLHQIAFNPATTNASYYCDGQLVASGWSASYSASSPAGLLWGAGSSANMGAMNFNLVEFSAIAAPFVRLASDGTNITVQYRGVLETASQVGTPTSWSATATNATGGTNVYSVPLGSRTQQYFRARLLQ